MLNSVGDVYNIINLANRYLSYNTINLNKFARKSKNKLRFHQIYLAHATLYAAEYIDITIRLHLALWKPLKKIPDLLRVFNELEIPLITVLSNIECKGVLINPNILLLHSRELTKRLAKLEMQAHTLAGEKFNLASQKQLQSILYEKQKLPVLKKTPGGGSIN